MITQQPQHSNSSQNFVMINDEPVPVREETRQRFKLAVSGAFKTQETFVEAYRMALEDVAGPGQHWQQVSPQSTVFRNAEIVARKICVEAEDGGMEIQTFRNYCNAARKCVMFNVPFSAARTFKISELEKARAEANKLDASKPEWDTPEKRMIAVFKMTRAKKQEKATVHYHSMLPFPTPQDTAQTVAKKLCGTVISFLEASFLKPYVKDKTVAGKFLRQILDLCQKYDEQEKLKAAKTTKQVM